MDVVVLFISRI